MKKISELGLEAIQLEDQVLLVQSDWKEIPYIKNAKDDKVYMIASEKIALEILSVPIKNCPQIIASTKPLDGLPLLVIEDEVDKMADHEFHEQKESYENSTEMFAFDYSELLAAGFKIGYKKAKEKFKFTEEDLRKALELGLTLIDGNIHNEEHFNNLIQSLIKKELLVEVEYQDMTGKWYSWPTILAKTDRPTRLKITEGKIKAVWK